MSPVRVLPDLEQVLRGRTNAETGTCPRAGDRVRDRVLDCYSEFLPTSAYRGSAGVGGRVMHFRLTARDLAVGGGGVGHDQVTLKVDPKAGPFLVTSFANKGIAVKGGKAVTVHWKVNGTKKLAKKVQLLLSTDNGHSWKAVGKKTANDGKASVKLPKKKTKQAWIMVKAVGNYFFDVNDKVFTIR